MSETYQCLRDGCKQVWRGVAGSAPCPVCGSLYVKWVSYSTEKYEQACSDLTQRAEEVLQ